jgi:L-amino acid N-acyltransferase YncA
MHIREASHKDRAPVWHILEPIVRAGEAYALPRDISQDETLAFWFATGHQVYVAEDGTEILGTYFLCANQRGGGSHVANCGYATAQGATGRGIARTMCEDSLERARQQGFRAMQFNFVVSTNERALRLWSRCGFARVGCLPGAFQHPIHGFVDVFVMYRSLDSGPAT